MVFITLKHIWRKKRQSEIRSLFRVDSLGIAESFVFFFLNRGLFHSNLKYKTNHMNWPTLTKKRNKHTHKQNVHCLHHNALIEQNILIEVKRISFINFAVNVG